MGQLVIFLGIDGVLVNPDENNRFRWVAGRRLPEVGLKSPLWQTGVLPAEIYEARIDPVAVDCLGQIVARTDAGVVISSPWRRNLPQMEGLGRAFSSAGFHRDLIIGATPYLAYFRLAQVAYRPAEISTWLTAHPDVERYVVIDNDSVAGHPQILTRWASADDGGGLQQHHVGTAIEILTGATSTAAIPHPPSPGDPNGIR